ncbi:MAG TPA: hypothetical protein VLW52_14265 [Opitutaceae bacterium]|nr:hypothetical protein [Opitutaceae bacterium]
MKNPTKILTLLSIAGALVSPRLGATVMASDLGTGLPPTTLGGYTMTPYDPGSIAGATGSAHETLGNDDGTGPGYWATWGQSYTGNVYYALGTSSTTLTLLLSGVQAVYFYEEPNVFADFTMTATDSSGVSVTTTINGDHGSSGVGFWETVPGDFLSSIVVTCSDTSGFAIGEFGIDNGSLTGTVGSVPDAASTMGLVLLGFGLISLAGMSRFGRRALASRA